MAHAAVPEFFNRLRTRREAAVAAHARDIRQHMEERLRARGKLQSNERFEAFRQRHQLLLRQRMEQPERPAAGVGQRPAGREARREQRQEWQQQQERRAEQHRSENKPHGKPGRHPD